MISKVFFLFISVLILSCQKEDHFQIPISNKSPELEQRFFEIGFIENRNPLIHKKKPIEVRSRTFIDDVYDALIEENQTEICANKISVSSVGIFPECWIYVS